ncbi:YaiI/YqxD family protein [Marinobacter sp.]|uniref:YaiI/YqxD family protein n=1 Tax=Marinobacter sp. TaxID=50741 RepID=UPI003A957E84
MAIWVDADACPVPIREILCRAATRWQVQTTFIANHVINLPPSPYIKARQVMQGFDVADNEIMDQLSAGDLVITQDIPLAAEAIEKGADVFNPRGQAFTKENIRQRLAMRNFMEEMRNAGQVTGGAAPFNQTDRKEFADKLDSWLQRNRKPDNN